MKFLEIPKSQTSKIVSEILGKSDTGLQEEYDFLFGDHFHIVCQIPLCTDHHVKSNHIDSQKRAIEMQTLKERNKTVNPGSHNWLLIPIDKLNCNIHTYG